MLRLCGNEFMVSVTVASSSAAVTLRPFPFHTSRSMVM